MRYWHLWISLILIFLVGACKTPSRVVMVEDNSVDFKKLKENTNQGFFYALPKTTYELTIYGTSKKTYSGKLSAFSHLIKYPLNEIRKDIGDKLTIDSISLDVKSRPDYSKLCFVATNFEKGKFFPDSYGFLISGNGMLKGTSIKNQENSTRTKSKNFRMAQTPIEIPVQTSKGKNKKQKQIQFDRKSLESGINKLLRQNDELIYQVNRLAKDSLFRNDSLLNVKVKNMVNNVEAYHGRINELKTLFKTYKSEDLGAMARKFSDIVHKMVELKTALAGAQSDISYANVDVEAMIEGIDKMIENYQQPFKGYSKKKKIKWTLHFSPNEDQKVFQRGLARGPSGDYYWEPLEQGKNYLASLDIKINPDKPSGINSFINQKAKSKDKAKPKGLYYNIPAYADLKVQLGYKGGEEYMPVGHAQVIVPQLGEVVALPELNPDISYSFDPFYGTLRSINQEKP